MIERDAAIMRFAYTFEAAWKAVQLYLYGNGAQDVAAREEPVWQAWLDRLFPAPVKRDMSASSARTVGKRRG